MNSVSGLSLVLSCGIACTACAQSTWSGAASTTDWLNPQNWSPAAVPGIGSQANVNVLINPPGPTTVRLAESPETVSITNFNVPSSLVSTIISGSYMDVTGTFNHAGSLLMDAGTFRSQLRIFGTSLAGGGTIWLNGGISNPGHAMLYFMNSPAIASGMTIHGLGTLVGNFTNSGRIVADYSGQEIDIFPAAFQPQLTVSNRGTFAAEANGHLLMYTLTLDNAGGTLAANAGTIEFAAAADVTGGTFSTSNGGRIVMNASQSGSVFESGVHFAGNVFTGEAGVLRFNFDNAHPTINNSGVIHVTKFTSNGNPAIVNQRYSTIFSGGGTLSLEGRTGQWGEALFTEQGSSQVTNATGHTFRGIGTFNVAVLNQGLIKVGFAGDVPNNDQLTVMEFDKPLTLAPGGTVEIALAGTDVGVPASGHLNALFPLAMGGRLRVVLEGSLSNAVPGRTWDLLSSPGLSGAFSNIEYPPLPGGRRWSTSIARLGNLDHLQLSIVCAGDFNGDDSVDLFDYLDFVNAFAANQPNADFNGDAIVDFFDYLDFVDAFSTGC